MIRRALRRETVRIGVSDYAQDQLGDIVYVEMPEVGDIFEDRRRTVAVRCPEEHQVALDAVDRALAF